MQTSQHFMSSRSGTGRSLGSRSGESRSSCAGYKILADPDGRRRQIPVIISSYPRSEILLATIRSRPSDCAGGWRVRGPRVGPWEREVGAEGGKKRGKREHAFEGVFWLRRKESAATWIPLPYMHLDPTATVVPSLSKNYTRSTCISAAVYKCIP